MVARESQAYRWKTVNPAPLSLATIDPVLETLKAIASKMSKKQINKGACGG
jgi:hypothetical protein